MFSSFKKSQVSFMFFSQTLLSISKENLKNIYKVLLFKMFTRITVLQFV